MRLSFSNSNLVPLCTALTLGLALAGCHSSGSSGGSSGSTSAGANTLTIASPHSADIQKEFETLWTSQHPDITIKWLSGGTADQLKMVTSQFQARSVAQGIGVDLFFGGGGETFEELDKDGYLVPLKSTYGIPAELNGVPLRSPSGDWVAAALSGFGILYNKGIAARDGLPLPVKWADLTNPKLFDRVELADPRHSGSAHAAYEIILQTNGWDQGWRILTGLAGNSHRIADGSAQPLQDVSNGDAVFTPAIDFYAAGKIDRAGADKLGYIEPKGEYVLTCDPIAILQGAPNPTAAQEFVDLVMSPEGQKLWYLKQGTPGGPQYHTLFREPALPSAYKPIPVGAVVTSDPYANVNNIPYDAHKGSLRRRALDDLIGTVLIDDLPAVQAAWKAKPDLATTGFVPISEPDFMKLAKQWKDPQVEAANKAAWAAAAQKHFGG